MGLKAECQTEKMTWGAGPAAGSHIILTHIPTGVRADGSTEQDAFRMLCQKLVYRGDMSMDAARLELGLKPWETL